MISGDYEPVLIGQAGSASAASAAHVGSKAAELARMIGLHLSVPPAFVLPTSLCAGVIAGDELATKALRKGVTVGIGWLESATKQQFGDPRAPLFVSVRSGAEKSMPGMLDTVLDVGMNHASLHGLIRMSGNPRLAFDSYRRFVQSFAVVVGGAPPDGFDGLLSKMIRSEGIGDETELDSEALERLVQQFLALATERSCAPPPEPIDQLTDAAQAVYLSWESARAREYRRLNALQGLKGTAVTVQAMVFGNSGGDSGAGVAFSRDPATGDKELYVDFLPDAQGEDVVSGRRSPAGAELLRRRMPEVWRQLEEGARALEADSLDVQDMEFTVERGRLFFLQTRTAKRTPRAALKIAVDLVEEGLIRREEALERLASTDLDAAGVSRFAEPAGAVAKATVASPGVACGQVCYTTAQAKEIAARGQPAILVRRDTSTEDIEGFAVARGILTAVGGRTAHAAVVARQLGKVCLVGCRSLIIAEDQHSASLGGGELREGSWIALDGATGEISLGRREIIVEKPLEYSIVRQWMDAASKGAKYQDR